MAAIPPLVMQLDARDRARIEQLMTRVADGVSTLDPFFDAAEMHMIDSLTQNFEAGGRPQRWSPLSPVTIEMKGSSAVLQDQGDLKRSINSSNTMRTRQGSNGSHSQMKLEIWAGDEKATFHQFVDVDPSAQFGMTNDRGMPMRPFILFQAGDIKEIEQILIRYVDDVLGGR